MGLDELDAIAEGVGSKGPIETRNGLPQTAAARAPNATS